MSTRFVIRTLAALMSGGSEWPCSALFSFWALPSQLLQFEDDTSHRVLIGCEKFKPSRATTGADPISVCASELSMDPRPGMSIAGGGG